jgi:hypothetical protein
MPKYYHDDETNASDPARVALSIRRFRRLEPAARGLRGWYWRWFAGGRQFEEMLDKHLHLGDSRAACVVSIEPLLVAAYTDELDCVAMLCFPSWLVEEHCLKLGSRLLTVNGYFLEGEVVDDLEPGPDDLNQYFNFFPVIAEFVSDDSQRIAERKTAIAYEEWQRCERMGQDYLKRNQGQWRNGSPLHSIKSCI